MARAFSEIAFTEAVKSMQARYGSRQAYSKFDLAEDRRDSLYEQEIAFLSERDSFYMASVGENGWPYVQHRGGPKGFLKVLDEKTIGFADFRGNKQYISVGNLSADDRVSLFFMDYPNRQRLKLWARARIVHEDEDAELVAQLAVPGYQAKVERGIIMTIVAVDWNCPQHITQRYTKAEVESLIVPLLDEIQMLKAQLSSVSTSK
jgi:predicted pyridoxine 5'-phosphate oxidase superfamily flavin-nucleotide-binding protein